MQRASELRVDAARTRQHTLGHPAVNVARVALCAQIKELDVRPLGLADGLVLLLVCSNEGSTSGP